MDQRPPKIAPRPSVTSSPSLPPMPSIPPRRGPMATLVDDEEVSSKSIARLAPHPRDRAILCQMSGLEAGRVLRLQDLPATLGRADDCSHRFDEAGLSRVHARISAEGDGFAIEDSGSKNGIFVNEHRVIRAMLTDGDRIRLGNAIALRFQLVDEHEEQALTKLYESSVKDALTDVFNRKHLEERLGSEVAFSLRHKTPLSVLMLDIDFFKHINDTHGHAVGDEVLRATTTIVRNTLRTEDLVCRYGGEEFVVVARGTDVRAGMRLAERLRAILERTPTMHAQLIISRTVSIGVASFGCCGGDPTARRLLEIADERLYRAKETGRNRVVGAELPPNGG